MSDQQTEFEFGGMKFKGGKIFVLMTALSTLGAATWGVFEFYKDYTDMKAVISKIDTKQIDSQQKQMMIKLDEAIEYTRDIKSGLRDDILRIEQQSDRTEDLVRDTIGDVRTMIDDAELRFETKREQLRTSNNADLKALEDRLNKRVQRALDNPLAN
jgi:membrane-bound ClpP family serine protease